MESNNKVFRDRDTRDTKKLDLEVLSHICKKKLSNENIFTLENMFSRCIAVVCNTLCYAEQVDIQNFIGYKDKIRKAIIIIIIYQ